VSVVVDANLPIVLTSGDPRRPKVEAALRGWLEDDEDLHAPALLPYEVASGLTRLVVAGALPRDRIAEAWHTLLALPIIYHPLGATGDRAIDVALSLGRQSAYDAAYLVLAQELRAVLWTFDGPLARNAAGLGFPVRLIE
jgi:predicted nucleic acid-binding protein